MPSSPCCSRCAVIQPSGLLLALAWLAGCATQGPNHIYLAGAGRSDLQDLGVPPAVVAGAVPAGEQATGLAYDFNTDHLFIRVAPSQTIRVMERPSGRTLREMPLPRELHALQSADLAIRSSDRHLFAAHPDGRSIAELTLFGETVRRIDLTGLDGPIRGLAYDQRGGRLLVLGASAGRARIGTVTLEGNVTYDVILAAAVNPVSLGYDSDARHFFVPLADGRTLGEFDASGALVRSHATETGAITALDAGPRSFVRVF